MAAAETKGKKRKSGDNVEPIAKKVKTTTATATVNKSADRPLPTKSALKGAKAAKVVEKTITEKPAKEKTSGKPAKKVVEEEVVVEAEPVVAAEVEDEANKDDESDGGAELTPDQTAALLAGFSSDEDEDEDDDVDRDQDGIPIEKLPALPRSEKEIARELKISRIKPKNNGAADPEATPGVIYISRLPHGFYEKQLRAYLSQFGTVTNLRLARNKKTGKSKHHAFVEFAASTVADIVVKTMDKYLMFGHILQCKRVPADQVKEGIWKGVKAVKGNGKARPRNRIEGSRLKKGTDQAGWEKRITRESERRKEKAAKLAELGYDFDMPDVKPVGDVSKTKKIQQADAGTEAEEVVKTIQRGKTSDPIIEETVVAAVESGADGKAIVAEKTTKRKSKGGEVKTTTEKAKKRKTKA
ncbi:putative RNA recognition motif domain, nucleotide-binding alpha-beta plait domain superfamily [Septoria linicola]|nr:putative RNA recognition motif domain, nucleotide-binding alpha-beta plait domain superfamily [Septoria linicola]